MDMVALEMVKPLKQWKPHDQPLKKTLQFCRINELRLKKEILLANFKTKKSKFFLEGSSENQK